MGRKIGTYINKIVLPLVDLITVMLLIMALAHWELLPQKQTNNQWY
jgi:hypothetical protein